jgi:hypothetical protein
MARMSLNLNELRVETFETMSSADGVRGQANAENNSLAGVCPFTAYVTCWATPRQEDFRVTNLCC